ncbi:MAG: histidine phosphatase family protein [Candidatus Aenigmatarchaeota archaeon]
MSIKITYFVHGSTTDNEHGISSGWSNIEINTLGKQQNQDLYELLKNKHFDVIYCSDLKRAIESANTVFPGQKIIQDKRLRECNYGVLNGAREEEVVYEDHITEPFPNGECLKDVEKRIKSLAIDLKKQYNGKRIALMAHKAPQLALEVVTNKKTWKQAISQDWRKTGKWQPGWEYLIE